MNLFRTFIFLIATTFALSFTAEEKIASFSNKSNSIKVGVMGNWTPAANMKGIDIYLTRSQKKYQTNDILTVSTINNLHEDVDLERFGGSRIMLQTSVLNAQIKSHENIIINELPAKKFVYTYKNDASEEITCMIAFLVKDQTGYQITASAQSSVFELNQPIFNNYINSLEVLK